MRTQKARKATKVLERIILRDTFAFEMYHDLYYDLEPWQAMNVDTRIELLYGKLC